MASTDRREALRAAVLKVLPVDPHDGEAVLAITKNDEPSALGQPLGIDMCWGDPGVLADAIVDAVMAADGQESVKWRDEWRGSILASSSGAREPWSFCKDTTVARRDLETAMFEGWPEPWIERRQVSATKWERVAE